MAKETLFMARDMVKLTVPIRDTGNATIPAGTTGTVEAVGAGGRIAYVVFRGYNNGLAIGVSNTELVLA